MNCNRIDLEETASTNQYAIEKLEAGSLPDGTLILARHQTAGRGVDGSIWESEPGKNLTFSMVIYPNYISADYQFYLNKAFSLGVCDLIRQMTGEPVSVKWPNDVYIGRGKVAGILIQNGVQGNKFSYCVAGIGLNVNQEGFDNKAPNPVSLKMVTGRNYDLDPLLEELCASIGKRLDMLSTGKLEELDRDYLASLFRFRELAEYIYKEEKITARITGVSRYGHLVLEIPSHKIIECDLKEIKFVI
jgi:BirA family biotin operon repressor/biotin-[acetyl-CoA-carboxylase] ligase